MKNFRSVGEKITIPVAPYAVVSGGGMKVGAFFGVASNDTLISAEVVLHLTGCYILPKATAEAWTVGQKIYWDDTNKRCTTTVSTNLLIGAATVAALAADVTGEVRLDGVVR